MSMATKTEVARAGGRPKAIIPTLRHHKPSGRAYVYLNGKTTNLGTWGSHEAEAAYKSFVEELLESGGSVLPSVVEARISTKIVVELGDRYAAHCEGTYVKRGKPTKFALNARQAFELVYRAGLGKIALEAFGPRSLKSFQEWLAKGIKTAAVLDSKGRETGKVEPVLDQAGRTIPLWSRSTINEYVAHIVRAFKWAVSEELVGESVYAALKTVSGLSRGRSPVRGVTLRDGDPVEPVADDVFESTLDELSPTLRAMAEAQAFAAMRPAEVVNMRVADLVPLRAADGSIEMFVYKVRGDWNKNDHRTMDKTVYLGPKATAIVAPRIEGKRPVDFVFTPAEAIAESIAERGAARKTKRWASHSSEARRARTGRKPLAVRPAYDVDSYRRAIERACTRAGVEVWSPNQLRHSGATRFAEAADLETAQHLLGHSDIRTTMIYAKPSERKAIAAARKLA